MGASEEARERARKSCEKYFKKAAPKTRTKRDDVPYEDAESEAFATWLRSHELLFLHVPNEGRRSHAYGAKLKRLGMSKGAPDFIIFESGRGFHGIAIEMKRRKYYRHDPSQEVWRCDLIRNGWISEFAHGVDEAIELVERVLGF